MVNQLLFGVEGLSMLDDAFELARNALCVSELDNHPDYLFIEPTKSQIVVEDILPIIEKGSVKPVIADKSVVVINHMEAMNKAAQNKLLLTLEGSEYVTVIGVAYSTDTILATVKSRMNVIYYKTLTESEFSQALLTEYDNLTKTVLFEATKGCPSEVKNIGNIEELVKIYKSTPDNIFDILHLSKEKDSLSYANDKTKMLHALRVLSRAYIDKAMAYLNEGKKDVCDKYVKNAYRMLDHEKKCQLPAYTANDFFNAIMLCVENV